MEGPVLTTPSSHRLRSAVSACAQPTSHSYFGPPYLGTRIQCGSHNPGGGGGGCIKKFHSFGSKSGGDTSSLFDKLNLTKKGVGPSHENPNSCSRRPKIGLNQYCGFRVPSVQVQTQAKGRKSCSQNGKDVDSASTHGELLDAFPKHFVIKNDFLSKLTINRDLVEPKRLYLSETCGSVDDKCDKVISGECERNGISGSAITRKRNVKIANYCTKKQNKVKRKNVGKNGGITGSILLFGKNAGANKERNSDQCYKCGSVQGKNEGDVNPEVGRNEKQEIFKWQPMHVVTRRTAQIVREIRNAWEKRVGTSRLVPAENVQLLFNDLQLFPSTSQEMLKCAQECSKNPSSKHLTFGEFYKFANDLIRTDCRITSTPPSLRVFEKNVEKRQTKLSRVPGMSKYEVFLGGSCNPTTWRTDFAIPELENMNITYYNPQQVGEWRPELLEVEHQAKENATVMFFVIDNQTRGVSALIEVAHLAGNQRKLILVIQSYTQQNQIISNEQISQKEYEDLKMGQEVLQNLVERQRIPVYEDIKAALKSTERILREGLTAQDLQEPNLAVTNGNLMSPRDIFDKLDLNKTGKIFLRETCLALRLLRRQKVSPKHVENSVKSLGNNLNGTQLDNAKIDFDCFTKLIEQFERQEPQEEETGSTSESHLASFPASLEESIFDVYLGGTLESTDWRDSIAIPMLTSENLRYFTPKVAGSIKEFTDIEAVAMETSFALLFVITNTARSIAAMAIAGHYIGRGANVVLCVQPLPEGATMGDERLTDRAVKDYNRGRMYLTDIAKRSGVAVFDEIPDAVSCVVEKCKMAAAATKSSSPNDVGQE